MNFADEMTVFEERMESRLRHIDRELGKLPPGQLACHKQAGCCKPVLVEWRHGKRVRKNLTKDRNAVIALVRKRFLLEERSVLEENLKTLRHAMAQGRPWDLGKLAVQLQAEWPLLDYEMIQDALQENRREGRPPQDGQGQGWAEQHYEKLHYPNDENREWHITSFGLRVRSKSELLIAEALHRYGLEFRYEAVIHIGNETFAPDFTIRRSDGKIFFWEHAGLTDSRSYLERQLVKSRKYAAAGIVPWDNLIVTYDNEKGSIDLRIVEAEIRNKLLV